MKDYNKFQDAGEAFSEYYEELGKTLSAHRVAEVREMSISTMAEKFLVAHHMMIDAAISGEDDKIGECADLVRVAGSIVLCEIMGMFSDMMSDEGFAEFAEQTAKKLRGKVDGVRRIVNGLTGATPEEREDEFAVKLFMHMAGQDNGSTGNAQTGMYI